jgi:hypothetical protein
MVRTSQLSTTAQCGYHVPEASLIREHLNKTHITWNQRMASDCHSYEIRMHKFDVPHEQFLLKNSLNELNASGRYSIQQHSETLQ